MASPAAACVLLAALAAQAGPRPAAEAARETFVVALDPGHGGSNLGAAGPTKGELEKHVTLDVARRVRTLLAPQPHVRVVLCRHADVLVPVRARVRCANDARADLFVSVHANASPEGDKRGTQHGFELYVLPPEAVDEQAALPALTASGEADAAWESFRTRSFAPRSLAAARRLELELGDALGRGADRGVKQRGAALDVLQGLQMPGVLVEIGFLDHAEDGPKLASAEGREAIAAALAKGIGDLAVRELRVRREALLTAGGAATGGRRDPPRAPPARRPAAPAPKTAPPR
jgi:N-acetylmuramoyl-L-alanine amidase